jgi:galactokinase
MNNDDRKAKVTKEFIKHYNDKPTIWVQAPGRVDLMGSHTDYNEGYVLTMAIDRTTWVAAQPRDDRKINIYSINIEGGGEFDLDAVEYDNDSPWTNYVRGVAVSLQDAGYLLQGFNGLIHSTVPLSSGVSSSAALEIASAMVFKVIGELNIGQLELALACQKAENHFVGLNCGILDQYTSVFGQSGSVLLLDGRDLTSDTLPIIGDLHVVICDTQAKRKLTGSEYSDRRAQCEDGAKRLATFYPGVTTLRDVTMEQLKKHELDLPSIVAKRCRFIIEENQRVLDLAKALSCGDRSKIRLLTIASYTGARDLYEIGSPEMELMMDAMLTGPGVIGARQAGAGFGGCMVAFVESTKVKVFAEHVTEHYEATSGITPQVYPVKAAAGAGPIDDFQD